MWQGGQVLQWHAVVITAESITGVPYIRPVSCDSCRISVPRGRVDSIRLGNPVAGFWKTVALIVGIPVAIFVIGCNTSHNACSDD